MNKRIEELSQIAIASVPTGIEVADWISCYNQELTKLVLKECYEIVSSKPEISPSLAASNMLDYWNIKYEELPRITKTNT